MHTVVVLPVRRSLMIAKMLQFPPESGFDTVSFLGTKFIRVKLTICPGFASINQGVSVDPHPVSTAVKLARWPVGRGTRMAVLPMQSCLVGENTGIENWVRIEKRHRDN